MEFAKVISIVGAIVLQSTAELNFTIAGGQIELIFQPMAETYLTYSEYRICFYHEISDYFEEIEHLDHMIKKAKEICIKELASNGEDSHICSTTTSELEQKLEELRQGQEKIRAFDQQERKRRAPLELVGTLANSLFGILSREDADRYNTLIDETRAKSVANLDLITEQTSVIEATINIFNETANSFKERLSNLESIFTMTIDGNPASLWAKFKEYMNDEGAERKKWNKKSWEIQLNAVTSLAIISLGKYERSTIRILETLSNLMEGNLFPFITRKQLTQNLEEIGKRLAKEETLPINPFVDSPFRVLQIGTLHSVLSKNRILTELTVPILQTTRYDLMRAIPVPFGEEEVKIISLSSNMILTDKQHHQLIPISEEEYKDCRDLGKGRIVCKQNEQILINKDQQCELTLLNNPHGHEVPESCETKSIPRKNYFIHLHKINTYFCFIRKPINVQQICGESTDYSTLKEDGFLEIEAGCEIKTDEFILKAHKTNRIRTNETKYIYIKKGLEVEVEESKEEATFAKKSTTSEFVKTPNEDFGRLIERVEKLKKKEREERNREWFSRVNRSDTFQSYFSVISVMILTVLGTAGAVWIWRRLKAIHTRPEFRGPADTNPGRRMSA